MSPSEISNALGLSSLKSRTWAIFKTSATKGEGLEEAMEWLVIIILLLRGWNISYLSQVKLSSTYNTHTSSLQVSECVERYNFIISSL